MSDLASRALPYGVSLLVLGAVVSPALSSTPTDGFPLSTYPMFSHGRTDPMATMNHVVGRTTAGVEHPIPPRLVANDEVLQAKAVVDRAVRQGAATQRELCVAVADRLRTETGELAEVTSVEVRSATYDSVKYFTEDAPPVKTKVFAQCPVPR